jgi:RimJ/RimL family protein N-acetyltransferase
MILTTQRLTLRPMKPKDIAAFVRHLSDCEVQQWLITPPFPYTQSDGEYYLAIVERNHAGPWPSTFVIASKTDDTAVGTIGIEIKDDASGELGYWLGQEHWGRGIAKEAAAAVVAHARRHPRPRVLWANADSANIGSQRVLLSCGFADCGVTDRASPSRRDGNPKCTRFELKLRT